MTTGPSPEPTQRVPGRWPAGLGGLPRALAVLSQRLAALENQQIRMRTATLVSFAAGQASITLDGVQIDGVPYSAGYTPSIGDTVILLQTRGQLFIINRPA